MAKKEGSLVTVNKTEGMSGFVFFLAWIGALVYFVQNSEGFWGFIVAVLQACVWPALVMHEVLQLLQL